VVGAHLVLTGMQMAWRLLMPASRCPSTSVFNRVAHERKSPVGDSSACRSPSRRVGRRSSLLPKLPSSATRLQTALKQASQVDDGGRGQGANLGSQRSSRSQGRDEAGLRVPSRGDSRRLSRSTEPLLDQGGPVRDCSRPSAPRRPAGGVVHSLTSARRHATLNLRLTSFQPARLRSRRPSLHEPAWLVSTTRVFSTRRPTRVRARVCGWTEDSP
jgi:hypothetical protein